LNGILDAVRPELPDLLETFEDLLSTDHLTAVVGLITVLEASDQLTGSQLDAAEDLAYLPLRVLCAIARWNAGDTLIPHLQIERVIQNAGLASPEPGPNEFKSWSIWRRHTTAARERLGLLRFPWRVARGSDPRKLVDLLLRLERLIPDRPSGEGHPLVERLQAEAEPDAAFFEAVLVRVEAGGAERGKLLLQLLRRAGSNDPSVISRLVDLLDLAAPAVREAAVVALGNVTADKPRVARCLMRTLGDRNGGVRAAAVASLGHLGLGTPEVISAVVRHLESPGSAEVLGAAGETAGQLKISAAAVDVSAVVAHLRSEKNYLRYEGARACWRMGLDSPPVLAALHTLLNDTKTYIAVSAAVALWKLTRNTSDTVPVIVKGTCDREPTEGLAYATLSEMGSAAAAARDPLRRQVVDDDERWFRAAGVLWRVGSSRADHEQFRAAYVALLTVRLEAGYPGAANLLGELGIEAVTALPSLARASDSQEPRMRHYSIRAIRRIRLALSTAAK